MQTNPSMRHPVNSGAADSKSLSRTCLSRLGIRTTSHAQNDGALDGIFSQDHCLRRILFYRNMQAGL